jgi:phenylalanyl-tRNA synthetase alpha chain
MQNNLTLSPDEKRILEYIVENPDISIIEVAKKLNIAEGKVSSFIPILEQENLIKRIVNESTLYKPTKRGKIAFNGLSERIIIDELLKQESIHMKDVNNKINLEPNDIKAGIGILRGSGLIQIMNGEIKIVDTEKAKVFSKDIEEGLLALKNGETISDNLGEKLIKRGFVEKSIKSEVRIKPLIDLKTLDQFSIRQEISKVTPEMLATGNWRDYKFKPYNVKVNPRKIHPGKYHPYRHFHDHVRTKLIGLGFEEMKGPLIEQEFWNFDALYAPQDHPAREDSDIFLIEKPSHGKLQKAEYIENVKCTHEDGWTTGSKGYNYKWDYTKAARLLLRPQGTSISARTLANLEIPAKYFSLAKCFRPDSIDATHGVEFYQVEGIVCDPDITFRDLLGILKTFATDIAGASEVSFRPDYYPFTSPSVELSAKHPTLGRIEFGGAGIFRPEVVKPFGIDHPVIAWGLGVDRLFMVKNKISDIRELFSQNLQWLRDIEVSSGISVEE